MPPSTSQSAQAPKVDVSGLGGRAASEAPQASDTDTVQYPDFGNYDRKLYAITSRRAGRVNAATITDEEHAFLLTERKKLIEKRFSGEFTRRDQHKLDYVRWSLDRIEDAKHGDAFDALADVVSQYELFLNDLRRLQTQLGGNRRRK